LEIKKREEVMRVWKDADGNQVDDEVMYNWLAVERSKLDGEYELVVGVDSHLHGYKYRFVSVVCVYRKGRGGFYYYTVSEQDRKEFKGTYPVRVRARMFHETSLAIELATEIQERIGRAPVVHIDASPPETGEVTSLFSDQLKGYATASGFECAIKPWAFASSCIADRHTK
jgi:predicted RNase H-related nuclease YkuK (DUF458 family)